MSCSVVTQGTKNRPGDHVALVPPAVPRAPVGLGSASHGLIVAASYFGFWPVYEDAARDCSDGTIWIDDTAVASTAVAMTAVATHTAPARPRGWRGSRTATTRVARSLRFAIASSGGLDPFDSRCARSTSWS